MSDNTYTADFSSIQTFALDPTDPTRMFRVPTLGEIGRGMMHEFGEAFDRFANEWDPPNE